MPVERDRIIGELAVEQGLLAREEAARYYSLLDQTPGAPPLDRLLLRDGRLTSADLERLGSVWRARKARLSSSAVPAPTPPNGHPIPLDAAGLRRDELLGRLLIARNQLTVERAREAR